MTSQQLSQRKDYLAKLSEGHNTGSFNVGACIKDVAYKIQSSIQKGGITIQQKSIQQRQLLRAKLQKNRKEIESTNKELILNEEELKNARKQMLKQKKVEVQQARIANEEKKKQIQQQIKKWSQSQKQIKQKHKQQEQIKEYRQSVEQEIKKQKQSELKELQKQQKKKMIEQKLNQIQENRKRRKDVWHSSLDNKNVVPKYLQMEKKFQQLEQQLKFQEQIALKNHKLQLMLNHEAIKQHEKAYLQSLQFRKSPNKYVVSEEDLQREKQFNKFISKDENKKAEQESKKRRRQKYASKVKINHPVIIDEAKKITVEIAIDKSKNPMKYNFLNQKSLNDFQIYGEFPQFELNSDPKQIGKQYLKELPSINKNSRVQKSRSTSNISQIENANKSRYIDYLQQFKAHRASRIIKADEQISNIARNPKQKQRAFSELRQKVKRYDIEAKQKLQERQRYSNFKSSVHKNKEINDLYLKSIKTKLACLEMGL